MSSQPLLPRSQDYTSTPSESKRRMLFTTILLPILLIVGIVYVSVRGEGIPSTKDPLELAIYYLKSSPVIDGHIDLPEFARTVYANDVNAITLDANLPEHFDIPRARKGHLGGFFWSIFTECPEKDNDFLNPDNGVRDALEQIDVSMNLINKYPDTFMHCKTADDVMTAIQSGKIASIFGLEGGHSLGNSLGVLRTLHALGIRYMTLTHMCNNVFADSGGFLVPIETKWGGLSSFGKELIKEMNRLGILIDISHVSEQTALDALHLTRAPVMLSHSDAKGLANISRNVPDSVLDKMGQGKHKVDGVVMINFFTKFASEDGIADTKKIADHVEYVSNRTSRKNVGIGSDYDGIESPPEGLEDVSKYPYLFAELIERGWTQEDLSGLAGGNILRVMRGMEATSAKMAKEGQKPNMAIYDKRKDLKRSWASGLSERDL